MAAASQLQRDLFAEYVAEGMHPTDAYEKAGFVRNRSSASRMTKRPDVAAKIAELRAERRAARQANLPAPVDIPDPVPLVPTCDNPQTMAEMGFTKLWIADSFRRIAAAAEEVGQFSAATTALSKIQNMVEAEGQADAPPEPEPEYRVNFEALGWVSKVMGLVDEAQGTMKDVTPTADAVTHQEMKAHRAAESET